MRRPSLMVFLEEEPLTQVSTNNTATTTNAPPIITQTPSLGYEPISVARDKIVGHHRTEENKFHGE